MLNNLLFQFSECTIGNTTGKLGVVMITSERKDDMIKEFKTQTVDEYFDWSRKYRLEHLKMN